MLDLRVAAVMVAVEFIDVVLNTLTKEDMNRGMSKLVFIVYSNGLASIFLFLCCWAFHRKSPPPKLTLFGVWKIFLFSLISFTVQIVMFTGIGYSSPTLASVMTDLTPAFTFILAILFRMEKLDWRIQSSQAKSIGTIVSIAGALVVTLYKGQSVLCISCLSSYAISDAATNWVVGGFLLAIGSLMLALLFIVLAWIVNDYPATLMIAFIAGIFVTILATIVSLITVRDPNAWTLRPDRELITICYAAVFVSLLRNVGHAWALRQKGPVYVAMFKPIGIVIAVITGVTFLGDTLHIGSVIGAAIIGFGFYVVMWGKAKEEITFKGNGDDRLAAESPPHQVPLLQNKSMEA